MFSILLLVSCGMGKIYLPEDEDFSSSIIDDSDTGIPNNGNGAVIPSDPEPSLEPSSDDSAESQEPTSEPENSEPTTEPSADESGEPEICDGIDNNNNGLIDEGLTYTVYQDSDGDGFGGTVSQEVCEDVEGYVSNQQDCDDSDSMVYPNAVEHCNNIDDDCNAIIDDNPIDPLSWYYDGDGDGVGSGSATSSCMPPTQYVASDGDCDDSNSDIYPGANEICDGFDNDCDGDIDGNANCPCDMETYNQHSYLFCKTVKNWHDAHDFCEAYGSYQLISIDDSAEQSWLWGKVVVHSAFHWWWIGYHNQNASASQEPAGAWEWLEGSSSYTNWYPYYPYVQPDNGDNNEDCAHIDPSHGHWNDLDCNRTDWYGNYLYFVCESNP